MNDPFETRVWNLFRKSESRQYLPHVLMMSLFCNIQLGLGFVIAEATLPTNSDLLKLFYECKDYVAATCQSSTFSEKIDDLCRVGFIYEFSV